jgi:hypothetical protein
MSAMAGLMQTNRKVRVRTTPSGLTHRAEWLYENHWGDKEWVLVDEDNYSTQQQRTARVKYFKQHIEEVQYMQGKR